MGPLDRLANEKRQALPRRQPAHARAVARRDQAPARILSASTDRENDPGKPSAALRGSESSRRGPWVGLRNDRANQERKEPSRSADPRAEGRARQARAQERLHLRPGETANRRGR